MEEKLCRNSGNGIGDGERSLSGRLWSAVHSDIDVALLVRPLSFPTVGGGNHAQI